MAVTQDIFWTEYTEFDIKIDSSDADEFIWKSKGIRDGNSHLWHHKYSLPCTKVLDFVSCRVTSKFLGIGAAERSWDDVRKIKSGKISTIRSYLSEKQSIIYTCACIESARIEKYHFDKQLNDNFSGHTWNEENGAFDQQLVNRVLKNYLQINHNLSKDSRELTFKTGKIFNEEKWSKNSYLLLGQIWRTIYLWYWFWEEIIHWWWRH